MKKWLVLLGVCLTGLLAIAAVTTWRGEPERPTTLPVRSQPTQPEDKPVRNAEPPSVAHQPATPAPEDATWQLVREIERALVSVDENDRDRVYMQLLPQLISRDASAAARLVERTPPGSVRTELIGHVARLWTAANIDDAINWASSLKDDMERTTAATEMTTQLARSHPGNAIEMADRFDIGRDNGSVEHMAQIWATENLDAALKWIHAQPYGPRRDQLLARIVVVQAASDPTNAAETAARQLTPGPLRDEAILGVARQWAHSNPEAAARWAENLADRALRERVRNELTLMAQQRALSP